MKRNKCNNAATLLKEETIISLSHTQKAKLTQLRLKAINKAMKERQ